MLSPIIKLNVSTFVLQIIRNDATKFEFLKTDNEPNINRFLNQLIPNLVYFRKVRREEIYDLLKNQYMRQDTEKVYECVNSVIDRVYFSDSELDSLDETIWFRPSQKKKSEFNEIEESESLITGQSVSVYIRGLLNEYSRLPQYKREMIMFDDELRDYAEASATGKIFHATVDGKKQRWFAFHYCYEYTYDQGNYLIGYNLSNGIIEALPLYKVRDYFIVERKFKPSPALITALQKYYEDGQFGERVEYKEELC